MNSSLRLFSTTTKYLRQTKLQSAYFGNLSQNASGIQATWNLLRNSAISGSYHSTLSNESRTCSSIDLQVLTIQKRCFNLYAVDSVDPHKERRNLFYKVHYPEDGKYTIKKLKMTMLSGRDPETGRIIFGCVEGGHKKKFRWLDHHRVPNGVLETEKPVTYEEKVFEIKYDPNSTSKIALVGNGEHLRYIVATTSMKPGDFITSTNHMSRIPVIPKEGNSYPVGSLPLGTEVCLAEKMPGNGDLILKHAGTSATIIKRHGGKVILKKAKMKRKKKKKPEYALDPKCIVVVGRVSNPDNMDIPVGSPNRMRWLGRRPRSGFWQRKGGRHGRKIRADKGPTIYEDPPPPIERLALSHPGEGPIKKIVARTIRIRMKRKQKK